MNNYKQEEWDIYCYLLASAPLHPNKADVEKVNGKLGALILEDTIKKLEQDGYIKVNKDNSILIRGIERYVKLDARTLITFSRLANEIGVTLFDFWEVYSIFYRGYALGKRFFTTQ